MSVQLDTGFPRVLDSTMRAAMTSCMQKFFRAHVQHIRLQGESVHLHFGGCFAKGVERVRQAFYSEGKSEAVALREGLDTIAAAWGDAIFANDVKTLDRCLGALVSYFIYWPLGADHITPVLDANGRAMTECSWTRELPDVEHPDGGPILIAGRYDMYGRAESARFIVDEKTTTQLGPMWQNQWDLRSQFTAYQWGAQEYGQLASGIIVRGTAILKTEYKHAEVVTYRPQWQVDRWLKQLQRDVRRAIACWHEGYFDFAIDEACSNYGGCPFRQLCLSHEPDNWIEGYYEHHEWNPLGIAIN